MLVDVTEPVERAEEMELLARRDGLTGLLTRTALLNELDRLVAEGHALGVLFVDLDGFKEINDTDGHELGDRVLTEVAGRLRRSVRESDIVGRWGGDEFVVIAPGARAASLPRIADDILDAVSAPMPQEVVGQERLTVSASVGISNTRPGLSAEDLIATADEAMYQAKREGKGRYVIA